MHRGMGQGQVAVYAVLKEARERWPSPLLGIDSDNGSEFLNDHLARWCRLEKITFTRSRPYQKSDQADVEQKNWCVVRRLIGYDRYETEDALLRLTNRAHRLLRMWNNHWQTVLKLIGKERHGARVIKGYDAAQTPYRRVLKDGVVSEDWLVALEMDHGLWGPRVLPQELEKALELLWRLSKRGNGLQKAACG